MEKWLCSTVGRKRKTVNGKEVNEESSRPFTRSNEYFIESVILANICVKSVVVIQEIEEIEEREHVGNRLYMTKKGY